LRKSEQKGRLFVEVTNLYLLISSDRSVGLPRLTQPPALVGWGLRKLSAEPQRTLLEQKSDNRLSQPERNLQLKSLRRSGQKPKQPVQEAR